MVAAGTAEGITVEEDTEEAIIDRGSKRRFVVPK